MARKGKKKQVPPSPVVDENSTEEESVDEEEMVVDDDDGGDVNSEGTNSEGEDDSDKEKDASNSTDAKSKQRSTNQKQKKAIPFMDTFYLLSSEDSSKERSIAARDLINHCFFSDGGINYKDSGYALNRLLNGLCSGRAASRQGFASCLSSFLRVAMTNGNDDMMNILKECSELKLTDMEGSKPEVQIRQMLRTTTDFSTGDNSSKKSGSKKNRFGGGKIKGIEERDHMFGRLFGILAVVRSGMLKNASREVRIFCFVAY